MDTIHLKTKQLLLMFFLTLISFQSCTSIQLISDYDEITDQTVNSLQEKVSTYFVKLDRTVGTDDGLYEKYMDDFDKMKIDLNTLEIRVAAFEKNEIMQKNVENLKKMISNLESLHKIGFNDSEQIAALKQPFNSSFTAMTKLLFALKRGEK